MKPNKFLSILLISLILLSGCSNDDNPTSSSGDELVGTWILTKIILISLGNTELNPAQVGFSGTIIMKSDRTFTATFSDSDGPSTDTGTWSVANGKLTMKSSSGETQVWPYGLTGNKLTVETNLDVPNLGNIPVRLEFTKQ
ncbi:MAG: lipocalin family protein [Ignavibacteria bacterium]|nr:lipocalin family protein [Ignavibacteria bacterium]